MFLDTSGLLALLGLREPQHEQAMHLFDEPIQKLTHNYVIAELVALATTRHSPRIDTLELIADLQNATEVRIVFVDEMLHRNGLLLLQKYRDKEWSLCDAVSFILMREEKIQDALTTDHHFEQAGFRRLLEP